MEISNSSLIKSINIEYEGRIYICKIEIIDEELININIYLDNKLKYKGNIILEKIQIQIKTFLDYNINEIFEEINQIDNDNFKIIKENNKYKLKIKFIILRRKKYLYIDLYNNIDKSDLINYISELKEIIKMKDKKIKLLQNKLNKQNNNL